MTTFDGSYSDDHHIDARDDGHECQRNPAPTEDEAGVSGDLWKRTYECAYHGCTRCWIDWYAPVFDEDTGWVNEHDCDYDGNDRVPELDLREETTVVNDEPTDSLVLEGECYFCGEPGVQVRYEHDTTDTQ